MTYKEILKNLCYYDLRNSDNCFNGEEIEDHYRWTVEEKIDCKCDNCFYGRTKLA